MVRESNDSWTYTIFLITLTWLERTWQEPIIARQHIPNYKRLLKSSLTRTRVRVKIIAWVFVNVEPILVLTPTHVFYDEIILRNLCILRGTPNSRAPRWLRSVATTPRYRRCTNSELVFRGEYTVIYRVFRAVWYMMRHGKRPTWNPRDESCLMYLTWN